MRKGAKRKRRCPVPDDFAANAHRRNDALMERYGVSETTVCKWRKETGLPGSRRSGAKRAQFSCLDSEAEIKACLSCPAAGCSHGDCARRKAAGLENGKAVRESRTA